jgi:hypothetical protein
VHVRQTHTSADHQLLRQANAERDAAEATAAALASDNAHLYAELAAATAVHRSEVTEAIRLSEKHQQRADTLDRDLAALRQAFASERNALQRENDRLAQELAAEKRARERSAAQCGTRLLLLRLCSLLFDWSSSSPSAS